MELSKRLNTSILLFVSLEVDNDELEDTGVECTLDILPWVGGNDDPLPIVPEEEEGTALVLPEVVVLLTLDPALANAEIVRREPNTIFVVPVSLLLLLLPTFAIPVPVGLFILVVETFVGTFVVTVAGIDDGVMETRIAALDVDNGNKVFPPTVPLLVLVPLDNRLVKDDRLSLLFPPTFVVVVRASVAVLLVPVVDVPVLPPLVDDDKLFVVVGVLKLKGIG